MKFRENPIYGRKVFFINPPFSIKKNVIEWLKETEYEVYIINQYSYAKPILRNFENAICFINIDEQLSLKAWFNFIKSFENDPQLKSVFLGIIAAKTPEASVNKFIMNLKLPGGYIQLNGNSEETFKRLCGILEINGAKGKRKFLSLTCNNIDALTGYIAYGNKLYSMSFENISSIGITCSLPDDLSAILKKNTVLSNVSLSLGRWSVITQCIVLSLKTLNGKIIAILLFTPDTPLEVKTSIRKFIYEVLNKRIDEIISNAEEDLADYSSAQDFADNGAVPDYNAPTDEDTTADDVEELTDSEDSEKSPETPPDSAETNSASEKTESGETAQTPAEDNSSKPEEASETATPAEETPEKASAETPEETSKE